jgi:AcrR family transcriptional regulator
MVADNYRQLRPRRGRPPIKDARQRLLKAAGTLFAQNEFHRVSTEQVAARAAVGKGTLYRYFRSKEVLYAATSIQELSRLREELQSVVKAALSSHTTVDSSRAAIEVIIRQLLAYFWDKREFFLLLRNFAGLGATYRRRYETERRKLSLIIRDALEAGAHRSALHRELDVHLAAEALLGIVRAVSRLKSRSVIMADVSDGVVALFLQGVLNERAERRSMTNGSPPGASVNQARNPRTQGRFRKPRR